MAARQATIVAVLVGLIPLFVAAMANGSVIRTTFCAFGLVIFVLGTVSGQSGLVIGGVAPLLFGAGLVLIEGSIGVFEIVGLIVIGLVGPWCLVAADASWWLRRDPEVDFRVYTRLLRSVMPSCVIGMGIALGAMYLPSQIDRPVWLLPVAIVVIAVAILAVGEVIVFGRRISSRSGRRGAATTVEDRRVITGLDG